jgi:hypothetical protein
MFVASTLRHGLDPLTKRPRDLSIPEPQQEPPSSSLLGLFLGPLLLALREHRPPCKDCGGKIPIHEPAEGFAEKSPIALAL